MRLLFIDNLKGFALLCMILIHNALFLLKPSIHNSTAYGIIEIFGTFAAPLFLFIAGFNVSLSKSGVSGKMKRGFGLIAVGLMFMPVWDADILHFIGLFMLLSLAFMRWRPEFLAAGSIIVIALSENMRHNIGYVQYWDVVGWSQTLSVFTIVPQFLVAGFHPVFPWFAFTLLGMALGKLYGRAPLRVPAMIAGMVLVLASIPLSRYMQITFYPASALFVIIEFGVVLILFGATMSEREGKSVLATYGKYTLSIYVLHVLLMILPFAMTGKTFRLEWPFFLFNISVWLPAFYIGAKELEERNIPGPLEWIVRKIT